MKKPRASSNTRGSIINTPGRGVSLTFTPFTNSLQQEHRPHRLHPLRSPEPLFATHVFMPSFRPLSRDGEATGGGCGLVAVSAKRPEVFNGPRRRRASRPVASRTGTQAERLRNPLNHFLRVLHRAALDEMVTIAAALTNGIKAQEWSKDPNVFIRAEHLVQRVLQLFKGLFGLGDTGALRQWVHHQYHANRGIFGNLEHSRQSGNGVARKLRGVLEGHIDTTHPWLTHMPLRRGQDLPRFIVGRERSARFCQVTLRAGQAGPESGNLTAEPKTGKNGE